MKKYLSRFFSYFLSLSLCLSCAGIIARADDAGANDKTGEFTDDDANSVMDHYKDIAGSKKGRVNDKIAKVKSDLANNSMSLDSMDGGADPGEVFGNHLDDISTMLMQFINPFSDCMDASPITGACWELNTSCDCESQTTYGQVCIVIDLVFFCIHIEFSIYWSYRMPVQKVETNRSFRSGYWFKPVVSVMNEIGTFLLSEDSIGLLSYGVGLDMARGQRLANMQMTQSNLDSYRGFNTVDNVDSDLISRAQNKLDAIPRPDELHLRNLELAPGAQANGEYHVMEEYAHALVRSIWDGWKYHFQYKPHYPIIPFFSEGNGVLSGRIGMFSYLGFPAQMLQSELSPMGCMWKNANSDKGRTPKRIWGRFTTDHTIIDKEALQSPVYVPAAVRAEMAQIKGIEGSLEDGCLGINGGGWIPVSTRTANTYMAQTAAQNFLKGIFTASNPLLNIIDGTQFYKFELPGQDDQGYDGSKQDDQVEWLRNDRMNHPDADQGECVGSNALSNIENWEMNYASNQQWGDASENQSDEDPFLAAEEWRRFRVCPPNLSVFIAIPGSAEETWPE
jgi:hypothetical protein